MLLRRSSHTRPNPVEDFVAALSEADFEAHVLIRAKDLLPLYISPGFHALTGISHDRFKDDPEIVARLLDEKTRFSIRRQIDEWDGGL